MKRLIFSILYIYLTAFAYGYESVDLEGTGSSNIDENKTIKELHDNIKDLKVEKRDLSETWIQFTKENGGINDFIKTDLNTEDKKNLENLLKTYYKDQDALEKDLKQNATKEGSSENTKHALIELKLDLYKSLTGYIKIDKLKEYVAYIKSNIEVVKEDKNIKEEIYKKEELLNKKVDAIKEKIEANNKLLDEKIKQLLKEKISEKINNLLQNPKFTVLETEKKRAVFEATLTKITQKKDSLKGIHDQTSLAQKKIEIYEIVEEKLREMIAQF
jgi:hypothetical protein